MEPLTSCVTLVKLLNLCDPQVLHLGNREDTSNSQLEGDSRRVFGECRWVRGSVPDSYYQSLWPHPVGPRVGVIIVHLIDKEIAAQRG